MPEEARVCPSSISIHRVEDHEGWIRHHWVRIKRADGGDGTTCPIGMYRGHAPTVTVGNRGVMTDCRSLTWSPMNRETSCWQGGTSCR
jgi:hypothetical protein